MYEQGTCKKDQKITKKKIKDLTKQEQRTFQKFMPAKLRTRSR